MKEAHITAALAFAARREEMVRILTTVQHTHETVT